MAESDSTTPSTGEARLIPQGSHAGAPPISMKRPATLIGSRKDVVRLHLDSSTVSNVHAVIILNDWGCYIHDLGSRTHTWVNGQQVTDVDLNDGDTVQIGRFQFTYQAPRTVVGSPTRSPQIELDVSTLTDPLPVTKRVIQLGRRRGSDLEFDEDKVSNIHAIVFERNGQHYVRDIGSRTGTWLDGKPIHQERLADGSRLKIGSAVITLNEIATEVAPSPAMPMPIPVPPPMVVSPQIDKPLDLESIEIESIPLEVDEPPTEAKIAPEAEPAAEPTTELDLGIELADDTADESEPLTDEAIAAALAAPEAPPADAVDLSADADIAITPESDADATDEDDLIALRRGWRGASRADAEPEAEVEPDVEPEPEAEVEPETEAASEPANEIAAAVEVPPEPVSASPAVVIEPIDLPAPPMPEPIVVPVDEAMDDDGAIDLADAPAMPVAEAIAEPELPLESDDAGIDEVEPVVSEIESDVDLEAMETGEAVADVNAEVGTPESVADESEDDFDIAAEAPAPHLPAPAAPETLSTDVPLADDSLTEDPLTEAAEAVVAEPEAAVDQTPAEVLSETSPEAPAVEPAASAEEIAEAIIEEPLDDTSDVVSEIAEDDKPSDDDPLAELDLIAASAASAVDLSAVVSDEPTSESKSEIDSETDTESEVDSDTAAPAPVADLAGIDFSELRLDDERDDEAAFEDASADTAFAVTEIDPFDLEEDENETAEPLMNLADSIVGETHDGVEVMEETSPTPGSALQGFDEFEGEADDSRDDIELIDEDIPAAGDTAVAEALSDAPDDDQKDTLGGLISPPPAGDLRDLIPRHGPLLGGAFAPQPQGFMVGGSPLVGDAPSKPDAKSPSEAAGDAEPRRPHRVGFGATARAKTTSPFAADAGRTIADVLIGRRAAASVDVFSNPSPTPENLLMDEQDPDHKSTAPNGEPRAVQPLTENDELLQTAERFRPRGAISAIDAFPQINNPQARSRPEDDPEYHAKLRRRRLRTVLVCTLALVPLIGGIVMGVFKYFPVESKLVAAITYEGLASASEHRKQEFKSTHTFMLTEEQTRGLALNELGPEWDNKKGFLASTDSIKAALVPTPRERWPDAHRDQMHLIVMSRDKENDLARLRALATAMVKADEQQARRAQQLRDEAAAAQKEVRTLQEQITEIDNKLQVNRSLGESRPDDSRIAEVEARRIIADQEVTAAIKQRQEIEASIERLRTQDATELAPLPTVELESQDDALKKLNAQVEDIRKQTEARNAELAAATDEARKSLDAAVSKLEADLTAAKQQEVNGQLADYVDGAKTLSKQMRDLTDDLLRRQEQQYTRLQELKQRLSDVAEENTRQKLAGDAALKQMKDELGMLQRQQSAAIAEGMKDEAERVTALTRLLTVKIEEAEFKHKNDPFKQEVIGSLQSIIDQTAKSIAEDRKDVGERLIASQEDFLRKAPRVEQLPEDQKEVAASIQKQFAAVAEARKAYSAAADAAESELAKLETANRDQLAKLQAEIHGRKIELAAAAKEKQAIVAEQNRKKRLEEKALELAAARQAQEAKESALAVVTAEKQKLEEHRRKLLDTERETTELASLKTEKDNRIRNLNLWLGSKEAELAGIIIPTSKIDTQSFDQEDRRPLFAGVGAGAVFLLMLVPIVHNLRLLSRDSHAPKPADAASTPGNGFDPILNQDLDAPVEEAPAESEPAVTR